jgi:hypothetical protein
MDSALLANPAVLGAIQAFEDPTSDKDATGSALAAAVLAGSTKAFAPSDLQLALVAINGKNYAEATTKLAEAKKHVTAELKDLIDDNAKLAREKTTVEEALKRALAGGITNQALIDENNQLRTEKNDAITRATQAEARATTAEQEKLTAEQEKLTAEQEKLVAEQERDDALHDKGVAEQVRDAALRGKAAAEKDRDTAMQEKNAAEKARDTAVQEKTAAVQARDAAAREKTAAEQARDAVAREKTAAEQARDAALQEKNSAVQALELAARKSAAAADEKKNALRDKLAAENAAIAATSRAEIAERRGQELEQQLAAATAKLSAADQAAALKAKQEADDKAKAEKEAAEKAAAAKAAAEKAAAEKAAAEQAAAEKAAAEKAAAEKAAAEKAAAEKAAAEKAAQQQQEGSPDKDVLEITFGNTTVRAKYSSDAAPEYSTNFVPVVLPSVGQIDLAGKTADGRPNVEVADFLAALHLATDLLTQPRAGSAKAGPFSKYKTGDARVEAFGKAMIGLSNWWTTAGNKFKFPNMPPYNNRDSIVYLAHNHPSKENADALKSYGKGHTYTFVMKNNGQPLVLDPKQTEKLIKSDIGVTEKASDNADSFIPRLKPFKPSSAAAAADLDAAEQFAAAADAGIQLRAADALAASIMLSGSIPTATAGSHDEDDDDDDDDADDGGFFN